MRIAALVYMQHLALHHIAQFSSEGRGGESGMCELGSRVCFCYPDVCPPCRLASFPCLPNWVHWNAGGKHFLRQLPNQSSENLASGFAVSRALKTSTLTIFHAAVLVIEQCRCVAKEKKPNVSPLPHVRFRCSLAPLTFIARKAIEHVEETG